MISYIFITTLAAGIEYLIYKYIDFYKKLIDNCINNNNTAIVSAINTYSIAVFTVTIAFIPLIYMVQEKIYFEEFMEDNKEKFLSILYSCIVYSFLGIIISLINLIIFNKIIFGLTIIFFILETIPFVRIAFITFNFIQLYMRQK